MTLEILAFTANIALDLFTITSMLAVGMSLTVLEIIHPLRNLRQMFLILLASFVILRLWALLLTWVLGHFHFHTKGTCHLSNRLT